MSFMSSDKFCNAMQIDNVAKMKSLNIVHLMGIMQEDPIIKTFDNGGKIAKFNLCTFFEIPNQYSVKTYHNIVIRNMHIIENFITTNLLKKDMKIYLNGALSNRNYNDSQTGEKKYIVEINVNQNNQLSIL